MDVVALAAVISTGLTSLAAIGYQAYGDRRRRAHDADQAFEERAWEKKSDSHYALIRVCRQLSAELQSDAQSVERIRYLTSDSVRALADVAPEIVAYGSERCVENLGAVERMLRALNVDLITLMQAEDMRRLKERAIDAMNFEEAASCRDREKRLLREATKDMALDRDELQAAIDALLESARQSVRSSAL